MIGRSIAIIVPPDRPDELRRSSPVCARGERVEHYETVRVRKDGSRVQASVTISPILGTRGEVIGAAAITRDVSERRRFEEALRDSEERYRGIVRHAAVGIARSGLDGLLLDANPGLCEAVAKEREELVGTRYLDLVHPDDRARAGAAIETLLSGGPDGETLDLRYCRNQRDSVWVSVTLSAIRSAEGEARSVIAVSLDVTAAPPHRSDAALPRRGERVAVVAGRLPRHAAEGGAARRSRLRRLVRDRHVAASTGPSSAWRSRTSTPRR